MKMKILAIEKGKHMNLDLFNKSEVPKVELKTEPSNRNFQDILDIEISRLKGGQ